MNGGPDLLPHDEPARFVEAILDRWDDGVVCRARVSAASPWARGGFAPATAGLEIAAQAAAWLEALERSEVSRTDQRRVGYLVRVRGAHLGRAIPAGAAIIARVQRTGGAPPLAIYEVDVRLEGESDDDSAAAEICRGTLGTYLTPDSIATGSC